MFITIDEMLKLNNPCIIDIRREENYNNNHIPNSKNIPYEKLINNIDKYLDKNTRYYIYCKKGIISAHLVAKLSKLGYKATSIIGGYENWILRI